MNQSIKITLVVTAVIMSILAIAQVASAQGKGEHRGQHPCRADVQRLCGEVEGRQEARQCLETHKDELSQACEARIKQRRGKHKGRKGHLKKACGDDAARFCPGESGRELKQCMMEHKDELSSSCTAAIKKARKGNKGKRGKKARRGGEGKRGERRAAVKAACGDDAKLFCDGERGRGLFSCMKDHKDQLSAQCTDALQQARRGG